ncbi:hypothetical protein ACHAXR_012587 [Thalassiosira sp. AJA248-18]
MPYRIAIGSCSHPSLPQPLWEIIHARQPAAFIWGGDAVYSDSFAGLNWTAVGLHRVEVDHDNATEDGGGWRLTFPPPSIHIDASPDIIRGWYEKKWGIEGYRRFVEGWQDEVECLGICQHNNDSKVRVRPIIYGTIVRYHTGIKHYIFVPILFSSCFIFHDRESNVAFVDFLYSGVADKNNCGQDVDAGQDDVCKAESNQNPNEAMEEEDTHNKNVHSSLFKRRSKTNDIMYRRALEGKGVYGVQLFDFSRRTHVPSSQSITDDDILWGGGYWVPDEDAMIDPDIISHSNIEATTLPNYSSTRSVAIFVLDVRSNKTPWTKGKHSTDSIDSTRINHPNGSSINPPELDFLGQHQWEWLQAALANSRAAANIIVSGLQIHPERFPNDGNVIEEWSKFPKARQMLYDMILNSEVKSPLLVSGDVHMSQILRKDCVRSSDVLDGIGFNANSPKRPLIEITTSGMTHSWGTSFSSQPRNHRLPLKPWTYFTSRTFMTICHAVCPWNDIVIRAAEDLKRENNEQAQDNLEDMPRGGRTGKQFYLGLNFAEFEFDFHGQEQDGNGDSGGGAVTVRIFGTQANDLPKLEMKWTFDQLSGNTELPGMTAPPQDFLTVGHQNPNADNPQMEHEWICVPHRGLASIYHEYAANITMFFTFIFLFFLPHGIFVWLLVAARRRWSQRGGT